MVLRETLQRISEEDQSIFRRQLAKEDLVRLDKLSVLVKLKPDFDSFQKEGLYIGWTQSDMRTHELKGTIEPVLQALFDIWRGDKSEVEAKLVAVWAAFEQDRLKKLVHCL